MGDTEGSHGGPSGRSFFFEKIAKWIRYRFNAANCLNRREVQESANGSSVSCGSIFALGSCDCSRDEPCCSSVLSVWGSNELDIGRFDEAIRDLSAAIEMMPCECDHYLERAKIFTRIELYDKAINDCNKSIEQNLKSDAAIALRGLAWSEKGDSSKALQDWEHARQLNPSNGESAALLAPRKESPRKESPRKESPRKEPPRKEPWGHPP